MDMNTINKLKAIGQDILVEACRKESIRFDDLGERGSNGEPGIRVDECIKYSRIYRELSVELGKDLDNMDRFSETYMCELWDLCIEEELISYEE